MNLSTVVLLGLAVVWAIVLAPEVLRRASGMRRVDPVHAFHRQMSSLDRNGGRSSSRPGTNVIDLRGPSRTARPSSARPMQRPTSARYGGVPQRPVRQAPRPIVSTRTQKRRQDVLIVLVAAAVLTLLCAVAFGGAFLLLHLVADVLLVAYVLLLNRSAQMAARPRRATYGYSGYGQQVDLRTARPQRPQPVAVPSTRRVAN
jgi:hypothetical protein